MQDHKDDYNTWVAWDCALDAMRKTRDPSLGGDVRIAAMDLRRVADEIAAYGQERKRVIPELAELMAVLDEVRGDPHDWQLRYETLPATMRRAAAAVEVLVAGLRASAAEVPSQPPLSGELVRETAAAAQPVQARKVTVQKIDAAKAEVREGDTVVSLRGTKRVWLLLAVTQAGKHLSWDELVRADVANAANVMDRRMNAKGRRDVVTPRMATAAKTLQNLGSRIMEKLGKLSYHWHQDGRGVVWSADCQ